MMNWKVVHFVLPVLCLSPRLVIIVCKQARTTDVKVLERQDDWQCPSVEERERARNEIHHIVASVIEAANNLITMPSEATMTTISTTTSIQTTTPMTANMPSTAASISTMPTSPATYICNGTPGWRRVAFINMTDTSYNCPTGLNLTSYSKRTCGRVHTTNGGCSSTTFSVGGLPYSQVCGRIRGYQFGATCAFRWSNEGIDSYYVEGVSLTHGVADNRQHIWTFAAGLSEVTSMHPNHDCPCDTASSSIVPSFVGNDYFCESGLHSEWSFNYILYPDDVLWDGENCTFNSSCCQFNSPPWFTKNLPTETTDGIELRLCTNNPPLYDDVPIDLIELYVQ